jgi:hypothetical protein
VGCALCVDGKVSRLPDGHLPVVNEPVARDLLEMMHGC